MHVMYTGPLLAELFLQVARQTKQINYYLLDEKVGMMEIDLFETVIVEITLKVVIIIANSEKKQNKTCI